MRLPNPFRPPEGRRRLNLALMGGGAHGAFTWGVLDQLLEDGRFEIAAISGTSAGAVNAAALLSGWAQSGTRSGPEGARTGLREVWEAVAASGSPQVPFLMPFLTNWQENMADLSAAMAPYAMAPMEHNPLRTILKETVDFAAIRGADGDVPDALIAATAVATGQPRLFRRPELTLDMVLASACLPALTKPVEVGGVAYWDGGFSANPDLVTLIGDSSAGDTLLITIDAVGPEAVPQTARAVAQRVSALTFLQPLLRDIRHIMAVREAAGHLPLIASRRARRLASHRFHLIDSGAHTEGLPAMSKVFPDREVLGDLHAAGRAEALRWLKANGSDVGQRNSVDLERVFFGR